MVFPVKRSAFEFIKTSLVPIYNSQKWCKVAHLAQRWSSSLPTGSAPSQLPMPGEPGWDGFIKNVERAKFQIPLTPNEVQQGQANYRTEKKIEQIQAQINDTCSLILKSNESLKGEIKHLIQVLHPN